MRRHAIVGAALAAGIGLAGCGTASSASPSAVAPTAAASSAARSTVSTASPSASVRTGQGFPASGSASAGAGASVAPGTVLDPHTFARGVRDAMAAVSGYRSVTHSEAGSSKGTATAAPNLADTTTIVDQRDPNTPKLRTESRGTSPSVLIVIGDTQYLQAGNAKYTKTTVPGGSAQLIAAAQDIDAAATSVTYVGPETIDGQAAGHYTVAMPNAVTVPSAGASPQPSGGPVSYDVWLDASGRYLKTTSTASFLTMTTTYSDYGMAPAVMAPDPSEVQG